MYLFWSSVFGFLDISQEVELLGHVVDLFLVLWQAFIQFFIVAVQFTFSPIVYECYLSSTSLPAFVIYVFFDESHSDRCEVISHCGFDSHLPIGKMSI